MEYRRLGRTGLEVSELGFGAWEIGWTRPEEGDEVGRLLNRALDLGINFIDTAPIYGNGQSEEIIGKIIGQKRDQWVIATKCGPKKHGDKIINDLSAKSIALQLDDSLRRLNIDTIDLYQCHWPDDNTPIEETLEYLIKAKQQGKIKYIGVSNFDVDLLQKAIDTTNIVTLQSHYSLLEKTLEEKVIPYCESNQIGILAYGPLGGGILTGKYKKPTQFQGTDARHYLYKYYSEHFDEVQKLIERLSQINKPLNQIALNWVRQKEVVVSALVGCRNADQVAANAGAIDWELSAEEIVLIDDIKCRL